MPLNAAVTTAVNECIEENILADFLRKNKAEAIEMCLFEYDEKREKELIRKAEFQEGVKDATKRSRILTPQPSPFHPHTFPVRSSPPSQSKTRKMAVGNSSA